MVEKRTNGIEEKTSEEFKVFMDALSVVGSEPNRDAIINEWMIHLDEPQKINLINKLRSRGIDFIPDKQYYRV